MSVASSIPAWRKSSHSKSSYCVEVAQTAAAAAVRDSKDHTAGNIVLPRRQWSDFIAATKAGTFDHRRSRSHEARRCGRARRVVLAGSR